MFSSRKTVQVSDEQAMQDVMALMDDWKAPEPSTWFDARMMAKFREEQQRAPEGFFAQLRDRWTLNMGNPMKSMMVGAMALVLVAGGSTYVSLSHLSASAKPASISATVQDLQNLDNNDQTLQQMGQLLDDDASTPQS
jgi:hypothetical protein